MDLYSPHTILGENCSLKSCSQQDPLPVKCEFCSKMFCTKHGSSPDSHFCTDNQIFNVKFDVCEKCNRRMDTNGAHVCKEKTRKHRCKMEKCKNNILIPIECEQCYEIVCISHRFPSDHNCIPTERNIDQLEDRPAENQPVENSPAEIHHGWNNLRRNRRRGRFQCRSVFQGEF